MYFTFGSTLCFGCCKNIPLAPFLLSPIWGYDANPHIIFNEIKSGYAAMKLMMAEAKAAGHGVIYFILLLS